MQKINGHVQVVYAEAKGGHLSGVQAEFPVETLVSMLSELSRLRVSYAWLPLDGDW